VLEEEFVLSVPAAGVARSRWHWWTRRRTGVAVVAAVSSVMLGGAAVLAMTQGDTKPTRRDLSIGQTLLISADPSDTDTTGPIALPSSSGRPSAMGGRTARAPMSEPAAAIFSPGPGTAPATTSGTGRAGARPTPERSTAGPTIASASPSASNTPKTYPEEAYAGTGVPVFASYIHVSGEAPTKIPFQDVVEVVCKVYDPDIQSVSPAGYWYKIMTEPWTDMYAAANTFLNNIPVSDPTDVYVDPDVPNC